MFKIVSEDHNDNDDDVSMQRIVNRIKEEIKKMTKRKKIKTEYSTINTENLFDECSSTLITFLSKFSLALTKA